MTFLYQRTHNNYETDCFTKEIEIISKIRNRLINCGLDEIGNPKTSGLLFYVNADKKIIVALRLVNAITGKSIKFINSIEYRGFKKILITDNIIKTNYFELNDIKVISLSPFFFGIYHTNYHIQKSLPHKRFSLLMYRGTIARNLFFYKMISNQLMDVSHCSYQAFSHNNIQETESFESIYHNEISNIDLDLHNKCKKLIPFRNFEDCKSAEIQYSSDISIVVESFPMIKHLSFSEKTFRALQIPRLWILYASKGSVKYLESIGFDVFSDYIYHARYDELDDNEKRINEIIKMMIEMKDSFLTNDELDDIKHRTQKNVRILRKMPLNTSIDKILTLISHSVNTTDNN